MKNNLKKLLLVCLMLVMFVSVSVTAFADTGGVYLSVKETYCVGKDILVTAKADAGLYPDAWVGFYSKTENPGDSSSYYWYRVNREGNAVNHESCVLQNMNWGGKQDSDDPIPVGEYTLYLFENYSHDEIHSMDVEIKECADNDNDGFCDNCGEDLRKIIDFGYCDEYSTTNIPYVLYDDGELVISGEGAIRNNCFYYNSDQISNSYKYSSYIKNVAIEAGVTKIGNSAFAGCENLTTVTLPDGLSVIGSSAFANTKIESIVIPNSVTSAMLAFNCCSTLKKAIFEEGITCIPVSIFYSCISLEEVVIPKGVTCVNANAFYGCKSLKSVTLPESITEIGTGAFQYCSNLEYINIPDGVEIIPLWAFDGASLKSINLENIKEVGEMAFTSCDFTELDIPASLTTIGPEAFRFCDLLEEINVDETNPNYSSEDGVLFNKDKTEILMYPASNERAFYTIPDSVATMREYAFGQSKNLESVIIPDSVETIYYWVFEETENIKNIVVPESVKTVKGGAFCCNNLEKILFLNPDCEINDYELTISESAVISGYKDSTAQAYAEMHNRKFEVYCPHNNSEEFEGKEATCTEDGYTAGTYCSDCETWLSGHEVLTSSGHNYEPVVTAPTCTEGGFTTYTCIACGDSYIDDEVAPLSHTADEAVKENEVAATCGKEGSYEEVVYCSACGSEIARTTVSIPALSHNYETVVVEPTCDKDGYTEHTCTNCGDTYITDETPALGHTDADGDGVCDGCGYKEPCMIKFLNWLRAFLEKLIKFFQSIGDYT